MDRRSRKRRNMEKNVSKIGTPRTATGRARPTSAEDFEKQRTLDEAIVKPRNMLPQSPMKIFAGLKLK